MRKATGWVAGMVLLAACTAGEARDNTALRQPTKSYWFTIKADTVPPFANEWVNYTITVIDRSTQQPVQNGDGQIYGQLYPGANSRPRTWDSFVYGPEVGTYHARLRFALSGNYSMGLRFRRDSLSPLEVTNWQQEVRPERGFGPP